MVDQLHKYNESIDLLFNGSVVKSSVTAHETAWTFGGIVWLWPIIFILTLIMVAIKTESPNMVAIYAIIGNIALASRLDVISEKIFFFVLVVSVLIVLYSMFFSKKLD